MTEVYVAGSIHHMPREWLGVYEKIGEVVENFGMSAYVPHIRTPQEINHSIDAIIGSTNSEQGDGDGFHKDIFAIDIERVENAKLIIAEVSNPSLGSGIELGIALKTGKPIICLANKSSVVTPLILGAAQTGMMHLIRYGSIDDALSQLKAVLENRFAHLVGADA